MKIAVHLHLYYQKQLPQMLKLLANLNQACLKWNLYVSIPQTASLTNQETELITRQILSSFPSAHIWHPENRGYDVGSFIDFLHKINLADYDYILKLHTKNQDRHNQTILNGNKMTNALWGEILLNTLLATPKQIQQNLALFNQKPQIGMLGAKYCLTDDRSTYQNLLPEINATLSQMSLPPVNTISFVAGTMFLCRASLLKPLLHISIADFQPTNAHVRDRTFAHIIERVFGAIIQQQKHQLKGISTLRYTIIFFIKRGLRFFYQKKHTTSGKTIIKICKLPIYSKRCINE